MGKGKHRVSGKQWLVALAVACILAAGSVNAATITFRSGSGGAVGTADPYVTVLPGPVTTGFLSLGPAEFAAARAGNPARIISGSWSGFSDTAVRAINPNGAGSNVPSGLYAIKIDIGDEWYATDATLDLYYRVDDLLGSYNGSTIRTAAVYLNEEPLTDTLGRLAPPYSSYTGGPYELHYTGLTLQPGENWIYINATNYNTMNGYVVFSGTLTYTPILVPEPVSLLVLSAGAAGLLSRRRR